MQVLLRSSSLFLHNATYGRVFFKQVMVQFPETWPQRSKARSAPKCCFTKSHVRVQIMNADQGDPFSTTQKRGCGERGDFIQLSSQVLTELSKDDFEAATYAFVKQWAHFRYGVFYEHGRVGHPKYPITYCTDVDKTMLDRNTCFKDLVVSYHEERREGGCHVDKDCHVTEKCQVEVLQSSAGHVGKSSIMFGIPVPNVTHFCGSDGAHLQHNRFAPNMQNDLCNGASTWDVIMRHKDFMRLPPPNMSKPIKLEIIELQQKPGLVRRAVLALDVSYSMDDHMRLETMKDVVDDFLLGLLPDTVHLAIVSFSEKARVEHSMEPVNKRTLKGFRDCVKKMRTSSATCIGCALRKALEVLGSSKNNPVGGTILLLTDGSENREPKIAEVLPELLEAKVEVVAMAMGSEAEDKLEDLAGATNGKTLFLPDRYVNTSRAYIEAIARRSRTGLATANETVEGSAKEESLAGYDTTGLYNSELLPQAEALEANAKGSLREGRNKLVYLAQATKPEMFQLNNNKCVQGYGYHANLRMHKSLGEALRTDHEADPIDVTYQAKIFKGTLEEKFIIDDDLGNNTIVTVGEISTGQSSPVAFLVDPTGNRCQNCQDVTSDSRKIITIPSPAMAGTWKVQVESTSKDEVMVYILVTSQARNLTEKPIVASCEVSKEVVGNPNEAVILVDVKKGERVVIDAKVTALVISENGFACTVQLLDDGKEGSTVISGPIRRKPVKQSSKPMPTNVDSLLKDIQPVAPFQRITGGNTFKVTKNLQLKDVPPARIEDLRVVMGKIEADGTPIVTLAWTWPGAHMNQGKAAAIEIRGGTDIYAVHSGFDSQEVISKIVKGDLDPLPAGSEHVVTIALPRHWVVTTNDGAAFNYTGYVAARVINAAGLKSETSRVIQIMYVNQSPFAALPVPTRPPKKTTPAKAEPALDDATTPTAEAYSDSTKDSTFIVMWIPLAIAAAITVIAIVSCLLLRSKASNLDGNEMPAIRMENTAVPN
nr:calcium-activated chloride channel regulator 1-like [Dermacentor andersoni]